MTVYALLSITGGGFAYPAAFPSYPLIVACAVAPLVLSELLVLSYEICRRSIPTLCCVSSEDV
jgi:hypothetical protein